MTCLLCILDAHECSVDERSAAFFVVGMVHDDMPDPCAKHAKWMVVGAAVVAEAKRDEFGVAGELRRIATKEPLRLVPPADPSGSKAQP